MHICERTVELKQDERSGVVCFEVTLTLKPLLVVSEQEWDLDALYGPAER